MSFLRVCVDNSRTKCQQIPIVTILFLSQYYTNATICLLLILLQDVDTTNTKMVMHDESTSQHAQSLKLPKPPEYMEFEVFYQQLMSLVSERPVDYARRAFSRALIDTSKLDKIRASLATDEEKATELLTEIGQWGGGVASRVVLHNVIPESVCR